MATLTSKARGSKVAALAIATALALTACATSDGPTEKPTTTLTFWHYWTDRADLLQKLATQYQDKTGVEVKLELVPGDALGQKFQAAAQADKLPDISAGWTPAGEVLGAYAVDGKVLNLSKAAGAEKLFDRFEVSTTQASSFVADNQWGVDPGSYLVPFDTNNMQILYNKELFKKAGITAPPTTLKEFIKASKELRDAGVQPFVSGFSSWPLLSFASMYIDNTIPLATREAAYTGDGRYDSQEWIDFLGLFEQLSDEGAFADGIQGYDMPAAETLFASGQAGMIFDGSWALGVFNQTNPDFKDYGVFMPPSFGDQPLTIPGGVGSTAFVVGTSPHAKEAVAFLDWLTQTSQQKTYAQESFNIPANTEAAAESGVDENIASFAAGADKLTPAAASAMQGDVTTTMNAGLQLIISGTDTPAAVAKRMQLAKETDQAQ